MDFKVSFWLFGIWVASSIGLHQVLEVASGIGIASGIEVTSHIGLHQVLGCIRFWGCISRKSGIGDTSLIRVVSHTGAA